VVTITGIAGHVVTYRTSTTATATDQRLSANSLPAGTSATVTSSLLTGTGTGTIDLTAPIGASTTDLSGVQHVEIVGPEEARSDVTQRIEQHLVVAPLG
jgi:hypothetical protein